MSSLTVMDSFDAPMLDYSGDTDVHMHTTVSSPKPWSHPEAIMEEDVHPIPLPNPFPSHLPQQDVEIDMDDYYNENVEYEMADGEITVPDGELVDIDVYDAPREEAFSVSASAPTSHPPGLTDQDLAKKPTGDYYVPSDGRVAADHNPATSNLEPPLHQSPEPELLTPALPQTTALRDGDPTSSDQSSATGALQTSTLPLETVPKDPRSGGEVSVALEGHAELPGPAVVDGTSHDIESFQPLDDSEQKSGPEFSTAENDSPTFVPQVVTPGAAVEESSHQAEIQEGEPHEGVQSHDDDYEGDVLGAALHHTETGEPEPPAPESHEAKEIDNADPHEISEGVYIEPPPPVLIELPSTSDQLVYALFNAPSNPRPDDSELSTSSAESPSAVLLQNRPTLYYETLNDVFDALREEERVQSMTEFVDGEMVIDAYDLQLVVSEDNVHAREISLHDLNVLHHGLGLNGPLRLRLRTVLSRFIQRYRSLQAKVTRLNVTRSANRPVEDSDEQEYVGPPHERDSDYYQPVNDDEQTERELTGDHEGQAEGVEEREDDESTYDAHAEYQGEHEQAYDESEQYADAQEYPQAHEDQASTREETDQVVANHESESVLGADPAHDGSATLTSPEYQEADEELEGDEVSGDVEVTSTVTVPTHAKENVSLGAALDALTEVPGSATTDESTQFGDSEERQVRDAKPSTSGGASRDEQEEELTEDAEAGAEADITSDKSAQSSHPQNELAVVIDEEEQDTASHDGTDEYGTQEAEPASPGLSLRGEFPEPADPYHHTEEEDNAEGWELDDGDAVWDDTFDGDEFDVALAGEPDSVSTGSSTLSGNTASITSKRSFDEVEESEPAGAQSSIQNLKKTRTR